VTRLVLFVLFALPILGLSQGVPTRTLGKAIAEHPEPFSGVLEVRELGTGSLVLLDSKDNLLQHLSANLQTSRSISRVGSGPVEYRQVVKLIPHRADTTYAYDIMNARFLAIDPRGVAATTVSLRDASGGLPVGPMSVRGYDQNRRLYYQGLNFRMGANGPAFADSAPLLRLDASAKKLDTLTWLRIPMPSVKMSGDVEKGGGAVRLGMNAYPIVDEWAIMPDGRVVVVRGREYRIDWYGPTGARSAGPVMPYTPVRVTEADKEQIRRTNKRMQEQVSKAAQEAAGNVPGGSRAKMPSMTVDAPTEWPEHKPAFAQGALRVRPNGELWIARLRAAGEEGPLYDVLSATGTLNYRVQLPPKTRLVGLGTRYVYVVRVDNDDLEYLGRYELAR
jgi:hypothetical protein